MVRMAETISVASDSVAPVHNVRERRGPGSALRRYRSVTYPQGSLLRFWLFEAAVMFLLPLPGGLGLALRQKLLRPFFGGFGKNVIIGRNCVFRNPQRIFIGDHV